MFQPHAGAQCSTLVCEIEIESDTELLILASRGLWDYLPFQTTADIARTEKLDLTRAAHKLRGMAIAFL